MNKSNLQVFIETSEKIASEKKQRLDEIDAVADISEEGKVRFTVEGISDKTSQDIKAVVITLSAFATAISIAAIVTLPVWASVAGAAMATGLAVYIYKQRAKFLGSLFDKLMKKAFPEKYKEIAKIDMTPGEQVQEFVNTLQIKLSEKTEMTEEEVDIFIGLILHSISVDEKVRAIGDEMKEMIESEENNELDIIRLTRDLDEAMDEVLKRLNEEAKAQAQGSAEPEEELAMVAESKQYDRWKVIAGVKK
jgi:hypothetical protein